MLGLARHGHDKRVRHAKRLHSKHGEVCVAKARVLKILSRPAWLDPAHTSQLQSDKQSGHKVLASGQHTRASQRLYASCHSNRWRGHANRARLGAPQASRTSMSRAALSSAAAKSLTTAPTMRTSPPCNTPAPMQRSNKRSFPHRRSNFTGGPRVKRSNYAVEGQRFVVGYNCVD